MNKFEILSKLEKNEISLLEGILIINYESCWEFLNNDVKGSLGMHILRCIIKFIPKTTLPENVNIDQLLKKLSIDQIGISPIKNLRERPHKYIIHLFELILNNLDIISNKIMNELSFHYLENSNEKLEIENEYLIDAIKFWEMTLDDKSQFNKFIHSKTFQNLIFFITYLYNLISKHEIYKKIYVNKGEYKKIKIKTLKEKIEQLTKERLDKFRGSIGNYKYIKPEVIKFVAKNEEIQNNIKVINNKKKIKFLKLKKAKHKEELVKYSLLFKYFTNTIFRQHLNLKDYIFMKIIPKYNEYKKLNLENMIEVCSRIPHFFLKIQEFFVQYGLSDVHITMKRYIEKRNFVNEFVYEIQNKYLHLLWEIFEKKFPNIHNQIKDINDKKFKTFFFNLISNINQYLNRDSLDLESKKTLGRFESLLFAFLNKTWFEEVKMIRTWSDDNWGLDINAKNLNLKIFMNGYPFIIRHFEGCWGVLYNSINYFGDIVSVFFKYRQIIFEEFDGKLNREFDSVSKIDIKEFLTFGKKGRTENIQRRIKRKRNKKKRKKV